MVSKTDNRSIFEHLGDRVINFLECIFVDDVKNRLSRNHRGLIERPACQFLSHGVHEGNPAFNIGGNNCIADACQSGCIALLAFLQRFLDLLDARDIGTGRDKVIAQGDACEPEIFVQIAEVVFEGIRNAFGHDLLHDRHVVFRRSRAEDLICGLALDSFERLAPSLERWRVGIHQSPCLYPAFFIADKFPEMHLLGHVHEQIAVLLFALFQRLLSLLALSDVMGDRDHGPHRAVFIPLGYYLSVEDPCLAMPLVGMLIPSRLTQFYHLARCLLPVGRRHRRGSVLACSPADEHLSGKSGPP